MIFSLTGGCVHQKRNTKYTSRPIQRRLPTFVRYKFYIQFVHKFEPWGIIDCKKIECFDKKYRQK